MTTFYIGGWRITASRDTKGRPYWRAERDGYSRGAPTPAGLRAACVADRHATLAPILKYPGSKHRMADWIVSHMPRTPYYVDLFCGSATIWFALWSSAKAPRMAVLNDLDGDIGNLFRVLRNPTQRAELLEGIAYTPWSRAEYDSYPRGTPPHPEPAERARRYLVRMWQAHGSGHVRGSTWRHQGIGGMRSGASTWQIWQRLPDRLAAVVPALLGAEIEQRDARALLREYADPEVLIYADPPYLGVVRNNVYYRHELRGLLAHARLLRDLRRHPGPALLSGYRHWLYDGMLPGWCRVERETATEKGLSRTECVWINPIAQARQCLGPLFTTANGKRE